MSELTPKQLTAANLLANGLSMVLVAEKVEIGLSTLYKWKKLPAFNDEINQLIRVNEIKTYQDLFAMKPQALDRLRELMKSNDSRTAIQACKLILDYGT